MSDPRRTGVYDLRDDPELEDLFRVAMRGTQLQVRTNTIGKVLSFNSSNQTAKIEVQIPMIMKDLDNPSKTSVKGPIVIDNIPVYFPKTAAGYLTFPVNPGDTGEILIQDRSPLKWLESGTVTDPVSRFVHNLAFGIFHPGLSTNDNRIQNFDQTAAVLESEQIKLGKDAIQPAVKGDDLLTKLNELINVFNQHTHIYTPPIPLVAAAAAPTATPIPQQSTVIPTDFQSEKVSVE